MLNILIVTAQITELSIPMVAEACVSGLQGYAKNNEDSKILAVSPVLYTCSVTCTVWALLPSCLQWVC